MTNLEVAIVAVACFAAWAVGVLGGYTHLKECLLKEGFLVDRASSHEDGCGRYRVSVRTSMGWKRIYPS